MIEGLEQFVNDVSDLDREWGPFVFLRPARTERMTSWRVMALAALYGVMAGMVANLVARMTAEGRGLNVLFFPFAATLGFFVIYRLTFAVCWNRRAERLLRGFRD